VNAGGIAKHAYFISFVIFQKPIICAEPAVAKPNTVMAVVIPSVAHIQTGVPEEVGQPQHQ